ncbi:MAG: hypothetical protein A2171_02865 [Candidatus Levybacteria bacterium RBG_13_35_9]|nr:MAG: hypothetical protein A2171_02865 [Candidatus Levybacteria bacterium RBG_13_35_9]
MQKKKLRVPRKTTGKFYKYFYLFFVLLIIVSAFSFWVIRQKDLTCANSISCINDLSGKLDPNQKEGVFMGKSIKVPESIVLNTDSNLVLGDSNSSNKHIYIDLTNQRLYAKEEDRIIYEFPISSGKWGRTPTGDFSIWIKLRATRMKGGNKAIGTYYDLPNVPYTMYFYNSEIPKYRGYGLHGAYWHNNFGHPMSHGCINISPDNAKLLYEWANPPATGYTTFADNDNPGTPITIYGDAPWE